MIMSDEPSRLVPLNERQSSNDQRGHVPLKEHRTWKPRRVPSSVIIPIYFLAIGGGGIALNLLAFYDLATHPGEDSQMGPMALPFLIVIFSIVGGFLGMMFAGTLHILVLLTTWIGKRQPLPAHDWD